MWRIEGAQGRNESLFLEAQIAQALARFLGVIRTHHEAGGKERREHRPCYPREVFSDNEALDTHGRKLIAGNPEQGTVNVLEH